MKFAKFVLRLAKYALFGVLGLMALGTILLVVAEVGMQIPVPAATEITDQKPFADYIGREYRVVGTVSAYAWNDFPDKAKILSITLMPPPGVRNRFVSYVTPLERGQRVRILNAWRQFSNRNEYAVSLPGSGLPEDVRISMDVDSNGLPDPLVYEPIPK